MFLMMTATYFLSFFNLQKEVLVSSEIFKRNWVRLKNIGLVNQWCQVATLGLRP